MNLDLLLGFFVLCVFPFLWVGLILFLAISALDRELHPECWKGWRYFCCNCHEPTCREPHPRPLRWGAP